MEITTISNRLRGHGKIFPTNTTLILVVLRYMPWCKLQCLQKLGHYAHEYCTVKCCFHCGSHLHHVKDCPFLSPANDQIPAGFQQQRHMLPKVANWHPQVAKVRLPNKDKKGHPIHRPGFQEVEDVPKVGIDNFSIKNNPLEVLFSSGVTHSFISGRLVR